MHGNKTGNRVWYSRAHESRMAEENSKMAANLKTETSNHHLEERGWITRVKQLTEYKEKIKTMAKNKLLE